jgi:DNA polymerase V
MYAIADCNNFYASVQRVFQPHLNGKPVVVLSNNDGCVIARSNETKELGVAMGTPYYKIEQFLRQEGVAVFSSNYALYGDMSQRVMSILAGFSPSVEVYSIDECFLDLTGITGNLTEYCLGICKTVKQYTGIPISIGIAPTKTLAKLANRIAKKDKSTGGVLDWRNVDSDEMLSAITLDDIWGISRRLKVRLQEMGIHNALELCRSEPKHIRQQFGVVVERIVSELSGISCIPLEEMPSPKKQIMTSRSFGTKLSEYDDLQAAITYFATRAGEKLRAQQLTTNALTVFIQTSPFDTSKPQYGNSATIQFDYPTSDTSKLINAAQSGLRSIFQRNYSYQKAGVLLPDLLPHGVRQLSLFGITDGERSDQLMSTLDKINRRHGKSSIRFGSELISDRWRMRQQFKSPSYTTKWDELLTISI